MKKNNKNLINLINKDDLDFAEIKDTIDNE